MANAVYPKFKENVLKADVDLDSTIKVALLKTSYTYSSSHQYYSSASADAVATSAALSSKSTLNGAFDAANVTFTALTGSTVGSFVVYLDTGSNATSPLIAYYDTRADASPVSYAPSGTDLEISWSASGLFSI